MLGSLISAGANLVGGLLGRKSTDKANSDNIAQQREFAQSGVQWRVADAEKAGVSPLVALGMSPVNFSPSSVGDTALPSALSAMGQDVGRAVNATTGAQGRMDAQVKALTLEKMGLENQLLASQIHKLNQVGPAFPGAATVLPGQGDVPVLEPRSATRMPFRVGMSGIPRATGVSMDAESAEQRYGDLLQEAYGVANFINDHFPWIRTGAIRAGKKLYEPSPIGSRGRRALGGR